MLKKYITGLIDSNIVKRTSVQNEQRQVDLNLKKEEVTSNPSNGDISKLTKCQIFPWLFLLDQITVPFWL